VSEVSKWETVRKSKYGKVMVKYYPGTKDVGIITVNYPLKYKHHEVYTWDKKLGWVKKHDHDEFQG